MDAHPTSVSDPRIQEMMHSSLWKPLDQNAYKVWLKEGSLPRPQTSHVPLTLPLVISTPHLEVYSSLFWSYRFSPKFEITSK